LATKACGVGFEDFIEIYLDYLCKLNEDKARVDSYRRNLTDILWGEDAHRFGPKTDPKKVQFGRDVVVMSQDAYTYTRSCFEIENVVNGMPTVLAAKKDMDAEVTDTFGLDKLKDTGIIGWYIEPTNAAKWLAENGGLAEGSKKLLLKISLDGFGAYKTTPMIVSTLNPVAEGVSQLPLMTLPLVIAVAKENKHTTAEILKALVPKLDELAKQGFDGIEITLVFCADLKAVHNTSDSYKFPKRSQRIKDDTELSNPKITSERKAEIEKAAETFRNSIHANLQCRLLSLLPCNPLEFGGIRPLGG
jgi:hypothetical protein